MVEEVFPHAPETIWKTLTTGELIGRWLMAPTGFEPVKGKRFTFQTKPGGAWDGVIHCQVLEVMPNERFVYSLEGRARGERRLRRAAGHGRHLDALQDGERNARPPRPCRLRRAEERAPRSRPWANGWKKVVPSLGAIADEQD